MFEREDPRKKPPRKSTDRPRLLPIRFGEYLRERKLLSEEQLLDVLADHWAHGGRIGAAVSRRGILPPDVIEREAARYHTLDVIEI